MTLLCDGDWPAVPGVCCWREGVHATFTAVGAAVTRATAMPPVPRQPTAATGRAPAAVRSRAAWLPPAARRPLAAAYRGSRAVYGTLAQLPRQLTANQSARTNAALTGKLAEGTLVLAESPEVAQLAAGQGVPPARLWLLAVPGRRLFAGESAGYAGDLARSAPLVGGFLCGSEADRESVERVAAGHPSQVLLYPPVDTDRPCPRCDRRVELAEGLPEPVAALARWRLSPHPRDTAPAQAASALLAQVAPRMPERPRDRRATLVAGHDLKFARELATALARRTDLAVTTDDWPELARPGAGTLTGLRTATAVLAEWARPSAAWLSRRVRPGQQLVVRLHRYELDTSYPQEIAIDRVDAVVYIAPLFGRRIRTELGWPGEKLVHIPNYLAVDRLDRSKVDDARFTLGFVGMEWSRKRFDLALNLLAAVRREDPRFRLMVRSVLPWHNPHAWAVPAEREFTARCFDRIERDPLLREAVTFDPPGQDMPRWYRRVGQLLSTSDEEGSHASVAEAMASGAVPVVRHWPGATEVYDRRWVYESPPDAVAAVLAGADVQQWTERAAAAKQEVRRTHDPAAVVDAWADLLHGDLSRARRYFPDHPAAEDPRGVGAHV